MSLCGEIIKRCIEKIRELAVMGIGLSHDIGLPAAFIDETGAARIGHPDLHGTKPGRAQMIAPLLDSFTRWCRHGIVPRLLHVTSG